MTKGTHGLRTVDWTHYSRLDLMMKLFQSTLKSADKTLMTLVIGEILEDIEDFLILG